MMVGIVVMVIQILKSSNGVLIVFVSILQQQLQPKELQLQPQLQLKHQLQLLLQQLQPLPQQLQPPCI
jgi:hypothetical protein